MFKFILFTFFFITSLNSKAQTAEDFAKKIAGKMKDSLSLTEEEQGRLYDINMLLHQQKAAAREQYEGNDSLGIKIQIIENTRDSLYREVLHEDKFVLYKQKKTALINNN